MQGKEQEAVDRESQLWRGLQGIFFHWVITLCLLYWFDWSDYQSPQTAPVQQLESQNLNSQILPYQGSPDRWTDSRKTTRGTILNWFPFSRWSDNPVREREKISDCLRVLSCWTKILKDEGFCECVQAYVWIETRTDKMFARGNVSIRICTDYEPQIGELFPQMWGFWLKCENPFTQNVRLLAQMWWSLLHKMWDIWIKKE